MKPCCHQIFERKVLSFGQKRSHVKAYKIMQHFEMHISIDNALCSNDNALFTAHGNKESYVSPTEFEFQNLSHTLLFSK
jgi:hypothetical protein